MVGLQAFTVEGMGLIPDWGTEILQALKDGQKWVNKLNSWFFFKATKLKKKKKVFSYERRNFVSSPAPW